MHPTLMPSFLDRLLSSLDRLAYVLPSSGLDERELAAVRSVQESMGSPGFDPDRLAQEAREHHAAGRMQERTLLGLLCTIASHPEVARWDEAEALAAEMEELESALPEGEHRAAIARHRGVIDFLRERFEPALEHFTAAWEHVPSPQNLANLLAVLLRLDREAEARELLAACRERSPPEALRQLEDEHLAVDPDLSILR